MFLVARICTTRGRKRARIWGIGGCGFMRHDFHQSKITPSDVIHESNLEDALETRRMQVLGAICSPKGYNVLAFVMI